MSKRTLLAVLLFISAGVMDAATPPSETAAIVAAIDGARHRILVRADRLSNSAVIKALGRANGREVRVELLVDKSKADVDADGVNYLRNRGVPVWVGVVYRNQNALIIDDARLVLTGCELVAEGCALSYGETMHAATVKRYLGEWRIAMRHAEHFRHLAFLGPPTVLAACAEDIVTR